VDHLMLVSLDVVNQLGPQRIKVSDDQPHHIVPGRLAPIGHLDRDDRASGEGIEANGDDDVGAGHGACSHLGIPRYLQFQATHADTIGAITDDRRGLIPLALSTVERKIRKPLMRLGIPHDAVDRPQNPQGVDIARCLRPGGAIVQAIDVGG
jgi:hypothetical protein